MEKLSGLSRRAFLKAGAAAGGGLVLRVYLPGAARAAEVPASFGTPLAPNVWLRVGTDDFVTIVVARSEMGQGVLTSMPMLVAEELDADWTKIRVETALADRAFAVPGDPEQATHGSRSVRDSWLPLRQAGAAARAMLVTAAAQTWGVEESGCVTENGEVTHKTSGRRIGYGALAEKASRLPVPKQVTLKSQKNFRLIGKPILRTDIPEKVNGRARFGIDVKIPGMLIARVTRCPVFGGKVARFDPSKALAVPGVRHVLELEGGTNIVGESHILRTESRVAVVADTFWAATLGQRQLEIAWDEGPNAKLNSADISKRSAELAEREGAVARKEGDVSRAFRDAPRKLEAVYEKPYLAHACMEPMNCTADVRKDSCDVWVPTQAQTRTQFAASQLTGLPLDAVKVHTTFLGGGFGRRGEQDFVSDAVQISQAVGVPIKVIWTREDDLQHDFYHPQSYHRLTAALDENGTPIAWRHRIVGDSVSWLREPENVKTGLDRGQVRVAGDLPYSIPNMQVDYVMHNPGIPVGPWRAVADYTNCFVTESFLDEIAAASGKNPYEFRRQLLDQAPRHRGVLELAATKAGWGKPLPAGRFRGIAVVFSHASYVAEVAEVSVSKDGKVRVHRVVCAVDCGSVVNPDTIEAQMKGGIVWGLTAALKGEITIQDGRVQQSNFHDYPMLRMNEMPEIEVHIVASTEAPGGCGEPSVTPVAAAVGNAIFAATGKRIRRLPIRAEDLRLA